MSFTAL